MKAIRNLIVGMIVCGGLIIGLHLLHAQTAVAGALNSNLAAVQAAAPDSIVQIVADSQGLSLVSPGQLPRSGTFWWILPNGGAVPAPCPPQDFLTAPIYQLGDQWLVDETAGAIPASPRRFGMQAQTMSGTAVSGLEMEADTVMNLIARVQTTGANQQMRAMGPSSFHSDAAGMDIPGFGDGGDGGDGGFSFQAQVFTTNDLFLQIVGTTNNGTGMTAYLVINTPWNVTNGVYDLFATTNLAPSAWQWVLRCAPGQTNLSVSGLASPTELFILGLTNDTDEDGLTDAYEKLVSHTDPNNPNTSGDGLLDGWDVLWGLNPLINNWAQSGERSNYTYDPAGRLQQVTGVRSGTVGQDAEGNVTQASQ